MLKHKIIFIGIIVIIAITIYGVFNNQKNNYLKQLSQAKLDASDIGYQAGYFQGQLDLQLQVVNQILQYGAMQVGMPADENGNISATGTQVKTIILIPYNEKEK